MKKLLFLTISLTLFSCATAQHKKSSSNCASDKYADEAQEVFYGDNPDAAKAINIINKGLNKDSTCPKIWQTKAAIEYDMKEYQKSLNSYKKLMTIVPDEIYLFYFVGNCERKLLMFDEAKLSYETYLKADIRHAKESKQDATEFLKNIEAIKKLFLNTTDFKPQNLGPNINTSENEYWPGLTLDGKFFYFTRLHTFKGLNEDFYRSEIKDTSWGYAMRLPAPLNTPDNEGTVSISADGKIIFFSSTDRISAQGKPMGFGSQDIYLCQYNNGNWGASYNMGPIINSESWEAQPSISPDGLTLYFSSNRPGGFGGFDIWMSKFKDGRFQPPTNLGPEINTSGNEQAPFIHYDNNTLYFSSDGHIGAGGWDIFVTHMNENGSFGKPLNVGVPINTEKDELGMIVDRFGKFGYLSSERPGGFGGLDIYKFELPVNLKPQAVSYVKGTVFDADTKEKLVAKMELTDLSTGKVVANIESMKDGSFFIVLKSNTNYMMTIDQTNYLFYSANFSLIEQVDLKPYELEVPLHKPKINTEVVLNNVFFDIDKSEVKDESKLELDKLIFLLKKFPFMKIEIGGHTDNTGDKAKNKILSLNRAKAVKEYLVSKGIDATRLTANGYGDSEPIADNGTPEGRAQNRRTVFKVLSVN
ncbi:MAG: PD40 domain-containing protein [Bacteroidia bacterium]|nr:PD40 domain-containing protein [Bacteroidia bacterium]